MGASVAVTIENGTGVTGADSFETAVEFAAFELLYFGDNLAGTTPIKEAALRRAFYYMAALIWKADLWPTFGGTIPSAVKNAQTLFARAELASTGVLSPSVTLSGQKVLTKVDTLGWSVTGPTATVETSRPIITAAFDMLRPYLDYDPARDKSVGTTGAMVV